jgi:4'-phosphopantetheinyl transferase
MTAANDRVQVFVWSLDVPDISATPLLSLLSDDERARARRLVKPQDGSRFIAARAGLRKLLSGVTATAPREIAFAYSPFGKPALADHAGVHFNLSHSEGMAVLAITRRAPVGIDLELNKLFAAGMEEQFLSSAELALLEGLASDARNARLVETWAAKEALIKLHGDRQTLRPREIELKHAPSLEVLGPEACRGCSLVPIDAEPGFTCILATQVRLGHEDVDLHAWSGLLPGPT